MARRATKRQPSKRTGHNAQPWDGVGLATVQQAADYLKVSRTKLYQFIRAGELDTVPMGRDQRVTPESLKRLASTGSKVTAKSA